MTKPLHVMGCKKQKSLKKKKNKSKNQKPYKVIQTASPVNNENLMRLILQNLSFLRA